METRNRDNILKRAISRRVNSSLPSNLNYQMMNKIRLAATRQSQRRKAAGWCWLIAGTLFLLALGAYILVSYLEVNLTNYMPRKESIQSVTDLIVFYWYIAILALILLALDYWIRWYQRKEQK